MDLKYLQSPLLYGLFMSILFMTFPLDQATAQFALKWVRREYQQGTPPSPLVTMGGEDVQETEGIGIDTAGNVYSIVSNEELVCTRRNIGKGFSSGFSSFFSIGFPSISFPSFSYRCNEFTMIYLYKHNKDGDFIWKTKMDARRGSSISGKRNLKPARNVAIGSDGIYIGGHITAGSGDLPNQFFFYNSVIAGASSLTSSWTGIGSYTGKMFVAKYDFNGKYVHATLITAQGRGGATLNDIAVDDNDQVFITGTYYRDTINFCPVKVGSGAGTGCTGSARIMKPVCLDNSSRNGFVASYDGSNGNLNWAVGIDAEYEIDLYGITADVGAAYVVGSYKGDLSDEGFITANTSGNGRDSCKSTAAGSQILLTSDVDSVGGTLHTKDLILLKLSKVN
ncbi:MAG: hypothetical protein GY810_23010, partial [Aureispira sp.]|nr:hypothetical protein [Aureispira sp.]